MQYGYFDDQRREYVITDPHTPVPWINYIGSLDFGGFVDHTGGLLICRQDPALNRITRYVGVLPASSFKGSTLYLRLHRPDGYQLLSPFFVPTLGAYDSYACHVGLGYSRFRTAFTRGSVALQTDVTIFVPPGAACVLQAIRVTNSGREPCAVDAIPVFEYTHPDALKQYTNNDWVPQTMQSRAVWQDEGRLVLLQYPFMYRDLRVNYVTSNWPVASFTTTRRSFLGDNEYGSWAAPLGLQQPQLDNVEANRGDNVAALLHELGVLEPGGSALIIVQLGQAASLQEAQPVIDAWREPTRVTAALVQMAGHWSEMLQRCQVQTPDESMNQMLNVHNPRQCVVTTDWSRYLSLYQTGYGARGIGVRDSSQDVMGVLPLKPEKGKALLRQLLQMQKRDGSAMHQFNPLTMVGSAGDSLEVEEGPHYYSDDHLWLVLAVNAYLKETGDFAFLDEPIPFYERDRQERPLESGSVAEHLRRALAFTRGDTGAHGLPLLGFADWNDTVNLRAGAESLFTANLYGRALLEMIALAEHQGDSATAAAYRQDYETMAVRVNEVAWDGAWYLRYFDHDGTPLGSASNAQGKVWANAQSWPVLSGFAPPERARSALDAVYRHLNTAHGIKLSTPGYDGFDPARGGVTTYPPGAKENGGIFLHANPWVIIAEAMLGNGERAFRYYDQINPAAKNESIDVFECEPYVYPQNILGDEHPQFGLARNSWLTGTASWAYQAAVQWILGVRPEYGGLRIDPCIPAAWPGFRISRLFRGARYDVEVRNPQGAHKGVAAITLDGRPLPDNLLPASGDGQTHTVVVTMGAADG
jgi:cellobiose phosphorylase